MRLSGRGARVGTALDELTEGRKESSHNDPGLVMAMATVVLKQWAGTQEESDHW